MNWLYTLTEPGASRLTTDLPARMTTMLVTSHTGWTSVLPHISLQPSSRAPVGTGTDV